MRDNVIAASYFERIESARSPEDLFPDKDAAPATYRRLARLVHPDVNDSDPRATQAFARLSELWRQYTGGGRHPLDKTHLVYETKRNTYAVHDLRARGDISNVYRVSYVPEPHSSAVEVGILKMPRSPKNNDLVTNEITMIRDLREAVPEKYRIYHPETIDSFRHRDASTGKERRAIILRDLPEFVSVREVLDAYPHGIDPRDMAWMGRRLWIALAAAHDAGFAHGAVFPEHVMIHPTEHGLVLVDWSYARPFGEKLTAVVRRHLEGGMYYGSRYDQPLDHRLDIRQASLTLEALLGLREARPFRAFFRGCRVASAPPAGQLFEEFDELLARLYGRRRYRPFHMPEGWKRREP